MRLRPTNHYRSPSYPAIAMAALAASAAAANGANLIVKGRPAPPKLPLVVSKPLVTLGEMAAPTPSPQVAGGDAIELCNTAFVSVSTLTNALGVHVSRTAKLPAWTLRLGGATVTLAPGRLTATQNGRTIRLPAAPRILNGTLYVPTRAIGEALRLTVSRRAADTALSTPDGRRMLILRTTPAKPVPIPGSPAVPRLPGSLSRSRKGS